MSRGERLKNKLNKKVIQKLGVTVKLYRYNLGETENAHYPETDVSETVDPWAEPIDENNSYVSSFSEKFIESEIRVTIDEITQDETETSMGGIPDKKKEKLLFSFSGDDTVRIGDKLEWPVGSKKMYQVEIIRPSVFTDTEVIKEGVALRDPRNYNNDF